MLIRFTVSNFMSFKEETEFNMLTGKGNGYTKHKNHVHKSTSGVDILKTAALYGANASGKSNLIKAIEYLKDLVVYTEPNENLIPISKRFRLDKEYKELPTTFRIECVYKDIHFDYAIEIHKGKITEEWLYKINSIKKNQEELLFNRKDNIISFGTYFSEESISYFKEFLNNELKSNQTVLNASDNNRVKNNKILNLIKEAFSELNIISPNSFDLNYGTSILTGKISHNFASEILNNAKTGIDKLVIKEINADTFFSYEENDFKNDLIEKLEEGIASKENINEDNVVATFSRRNQYHCFKKHEDNYFVSLLKTKHHLSDELFDFHEESDGTNRLFELSPAFDDLINGDNTVFIIDELERSMHPILVKELVKLFSTKKTKNNQLIFTTHESQLLDFDLFRQDEIWFAEKKKNGSTEFYPLSKFKPREDKNIRKGYLQGRYGGIPFLGDFSKLETITDE
ncbi:ATP-binding protein [Tenacibaculum finnmarkense genomovar finnmarkense]|uniref:AAA family ATPase n=2 Tax=Tenacibaculum finnmarkense TaxID=2781243 RepID=UPI001E605493|nr:ATP-binding protein [Tenacibaculum finnmarkense]MCD8416159.1 ATP-binding protein [Tenacibaculum finnmarkense genomovar finnmarkense]MCG8184819.1 ATP-binding protein [Tenacibaculum finnmarkense genomovar finnmarkense]MCG8201347.1 ATP-binding protein [Tenacibaculum finnmarkense genomovar finnmarkense]MCG8210660.1 ATP-binding protein [Tenacibaculum finnmarkense genomovar finnmarkense]MCG8211907.1 ATP-binding protein [Tenacibaculum finnmarkense genomovar finnmarkense]